MSRRVAVLALALAGGAVSLARAQPAETVPGAATAAAEGGEGDASVALVPPRVVATVRGPDPAYVGEKVEIEVALMRDDRNEDNPPAFFPEIRVRGAIAVRTDYAPPPEIRREDGVPFLTQLRRYLVFPQHAGTFEVPPIEASFPGPDGEPLRVASAAVSFEAKTPAGSGDSPPLVSRDVRIVRRVEGALEGIRVGDAFTVTTELTAADLDAVMLPALPGGELEGLTRYEGEARSETRVERGRFTARREESTTYVARDLGRYVLPPLSVRWLDPEAGAYHEATAPALRFFVRPNPSLGRGCLGGSRAVGRVVAGLALLVALALGLVRARRWYRRRRAAGLRVAPSAAETAAFRAVEAAAASNDDGRTLGALYSWLRFAVPGDAPTLDAMLSDGQDLELVRAARALEARISGTGGDGRAEDLIGPLRRYRRGRRRHGTASRLPALNG